MEKLTAKEEEMMRFFWKKGPLFVRELIDFYDPPKPHFNTLSTFVRSLEEKGYLGHQSFGKSYRYYALVDEATFGEQNIKHIVGKYFNDSYLQAVTALVKEEKLSVDDLKQLIDLVEQHANDSHNG